ncbi:hypothetical protein CBR_g4163 [Chara braunii]|uniref:Uncharacterized protein n=1 Tax=Chara braunii TaxID=69332 RepID=A0A388KHI6_CHABU|nr:hypothetical protein CBR_g4163 [Chara braunii]|eukprot:GBG69468.1 hypothetical protein CBR_g4163 [Chara braunii]
MSRRRLSLFGLSSNIPTLWQSAHTPSFSYRVKQISVSILKEEKRSDWWEAYAELVFCLLEVEFCWSEPAPYGEGPELPDDEVELLIVQAWRIATEGDLLGILFGKVDVANNALITSELLEFLTQLVDDLPVDILSCVPILNEEKWSDWWEAYTELVFSLLEVEFRWSEPAPYGEGPKLPDDEVELLIVQAWRTAKEKDLLGILFGKVDDGNLALITSEMLEFLTQLVDDLPLDVLSRCDNQSGTHVLSRTLEPRLLWSTCSELDGDNCVYPSQALFLEIDVTDLTVWDPIIRKANARQEEHEGEEECKEEEVEEKEEEEEKKKDEESSRDSDDPDYIQEEKEDEEEEEPAEEEEMVGGPSQEPERSKEEEGARARKRLEKVEGKRPVEEWSPPDLLLGNPWLDLEPPKEDKANDGTAAEELGRC